MGQDKAEALRGFLNIRDTPQGFLPLSVWQYGRIAEQADLYRRSGMLMVTHYATGLTPYAKTYGATAGKNRLRTLALSYVHPDKGTFETDVWDFDLMPDAASAALVLSTVFSGSGKDVLAEDAQNLLAWVWHLCGDNAQTGRGVAETRLLDLRMLSRVAVYDLERRYRTAPDADKRPYLSGKLSDSKGFKENAADANDVTDYMMLLPEIEEKEGQGGVRGVRGNRACLKDACREGGPLMPGVRREMSEHNRHCLSYALWLLSGEAPTPDGLFYGDIEAKICHAIDNPGTATAFYLKYGEETVKRLSVLHRRGLSFNCGKALRLAGEMEAESLRLLEGTAAELNLPELEAEKWMLSDRSVGNSVKVNDFWCGVFKRVKPDIVFRSDANGLMKFGTKDMLALGWDQGETAPLFKLVSGLHANKTLSTMLHNLSDYVANDGRLHPFLSVAASTDRLSVREPATQNFPRLPAFRSAVDPGPGRVVVSADYGQMELRNAAAIAVRSQQRAFAELSAEFKNPGSSARIAAATGLEREMWQILLNIFPLQNTDVLEAGMRRYAAMAGSLRRHLLACIDGFSRNERNFDFREASAIYGHPLASYADLRDACDLTEMKVYAAKLRLGQLAAGKRYISTLRGVFERGLDPHLITGMSLAGADAGYAQSLHAGTPEYERAKVQYGEERRKAKAVNFGLIYGMNEESLYTSGIVSYGLDWTREEAAQARERFFDLYPELGFCQKFEILRPVVLERAWVARGSAQKRYLDTVPGRMYEVESLTGRRYCVYSIQDALNYRNQGTGAHIIQDAVNCLPGDVFSCLSNQIHDELTAEVELGQEREVASELERVMTEAAEEVLRPYGVPVTVDVTVGDDWGVESVRKQPVPEGGGHHVVIEAAVPENWVVQPQI